MFVLKFTQDKAHVHETDEVEVNGLNQTLLKQNSPKMDSFFLPFEINSQITFFFLDNNKYLEEKLTSFVIFYNF